MGTTTILDIIGALVIGGIMMASLHSVNQNVLTNMYYYNSDIINQSNLVSVVDFLERDIKRLGYSSDPALLPTPAKSILVADTSRIKFAGDIDNNGVIDTVTYYIGPLSDLASTPNPRDRILYRRIDPGARVTPNPGVTEFSLLFFDALSDTLPLPLPASETGRIAAIQISVRVESANSVDEQYALAFWRQIRVSARNLKNR
ncbi:MAG: hypothetical protein HRU80_05840 [Ignavibacteriales bacterium]|nr:hypothetical protein [Ignavibacteriaceae bacterium]MCK6615836.1 hypothetical protein [Ignavibacteriaceae bacterium]QOJ28417.1 MAG: hypothetical protein HRU80_05840 [Ignavibacteriales bacterium]